MKFTQKEKIVLAVIAAGIIILVISLVIYFVSNSGSSDETPKESDSISESVSPGISDSDYLTSSESGISSPDEDSSLDSQSETGSVPTLPVSSMPDPTATLAAPTVTPVPGTSLFNWPKPNQPAFSQVKSVNGIPRLFVNNVQVPPLMFFGNTDMFARRAVIISQIEKAAKSNIHLHSITSSPPIGEDHPPEVQYFNLENHFDAVLEGDPEGYILLRTNFGKFYNTSMYPDSEIVKYVTVRTQHLPMVSIASDIWFEDAKKMFREMIEFIHRHPVYSNHVIGYHLECDEWFQYMHRENGVDISPANTRKFREWLTSKYKTDSALKTAWNNPLITLKTAVVPEDLPGNLNGVPENRTLMLRGDDRRYIDYLDYIGELVTNRIEGLAKVAKETSKNKSIVIAFYGYHFELTDPRSGHFNLEKLLNSKYLDGFASPESYIDRNFGGLLPRTPAGSTGAFMSPVDTIQSAGKLWFVESDQRTFINRYDATTEHDTYLKPMETIEEVLEVSKRDIGINMIKGAAIWYMDLWSVGWLDDQRIWDTNGKLAEVYHAYAKTRKAPSKIDVAFVVDEKSQSLVAQPTDSAFHFLSHQRYDLYRAGINWGLHTTRDIYNGKLDNVKVIVMLNPYRFTAGEISKIKQAAAGKTIVFVYGFGEMSESNIKSLTGMDIKQMDDRTSIRMTPGNNANAFGLAGISSFGENVNASPRWHVTGGADAHIGRYSDGKIGFAVKDNGTYKSVFFGGMRMSTDVIRAIVQYSGSSHIFLKTDDVSAANENLLVVHSSKTGIKTINFPIKCDIYDYFENRWYMNTDNIKVSIPNGETRYFFYGKKSEIDAMKIPKW